jgi:hypothetical protein
VPPMPMLAIVRLAPPALVRVAVWVEVLPATTLPKASGSGSPQLGVGRGGSSWMPPQLRKIMAARAWWEWKP